MTIIREKEIIERIEKDKEETISEKEKTGNSVKPKKSK